MNQDQLVSVPVKIRGGSPLVDVVGICQTCNSGIVIPMIAAECEKGRTLRKYCKPECRTNRKKGRNRR